MTQAEEIIDLWRVPDGESIQLKDYDPGWNGDPKLPKAERKRFAEEVPTQDVSALAAVQERLYAADTWSILIILKFFLHLSKDEQRKRFLKRLKEPAKQWKFSSADLAERGFWNDYKKAFEDAISATSTKWAPWYIIPADHKWVSRALVARIVTNATEALDVRYPEMTKEQRVIIAEAKKQLESEKEN